MNSAIVELTVRVWCVCSYASDEGTGVSDKREWEIPDNWTVTGFAKTFKHIH